VGGGFQDGQGASAGAGEIGGCEVVRNGKKNDPGVFPGGLIPRDSPEIKGDGLYFRGHSFFLCLKSDEFAKTLKMALFVIPAKVAIQ
jgi:hypothetical protein